MKRILLILSILSIALTGNTQLQQMWLGGQTGGGGAGTNLDGYSFDAVYALENLYSSWVGNDVVLVRRISDNTESGFTSTEVSDGTLASFCTGTNCVVKTIYDQSGNTNDVIQTSASLQPLIAVSGTVLTSNGKPAIYFDGSNDQAVGSSETAISVFVVAANDGLTTANYVCSFPTAGIFWGGTSGSISGVGMFDGSVIVQSSVEDNNVHLGSFKYASSATVHVDGALEASGSLAAGVTGNVTLGSRGGLLYFKGYFSMAAISSTDQASNRSAIETIINSIYSIY